MKILKAIARLFIDPDPEPGSLWVLKAQEGDPWVRERNLYKVLEVKNGYVRYENQCEERSIQVSTFKWAYCPNYEERKKP